MLAIGKRIGLTLVELNELTVQDLFYLADSYTGASKDKPREATQDDIDAFYRG